MKFVILLILFTNLYTNVICQNSIDTIDVPYSKYSFSASPEKIRRYARTFLIYKLGYPIKTNDSLSNIFYEEVSKEEYDLYINCSNKITACSNCWIRFYHQNGNPSLEGLFNTDCPIGEIKNYDTDGKLISSKIYTTNFNKELFPTRCSIKTGEWLFFNSDGSKKKKEIYKDDILINTKHF